MKQIAMGALLALAFVSVAFGQGNNEGVQKTKCTLTLAQAPELRGFRLGMNQEQVLARFPDISIEPASELGLAKLRLTFIDPENYPRYGRDRGVQIDTSAGTAEGRSYMVDSSKFPDLKGVKKIRLRFIDGRISYIQVGYDDSIKWNSLDEFARTISKTLGLSGEWQDGFDSESYRKEKILVCDGLLITASLGGDTGDYRVGAQLSLEDTAANQTSEKRQKELEEKKKREEEERRKTFKP